MSDNHGWSARRMSDGSVRYTSRENPVAMAPSTFPASSSSSPLPTGNDALHTPVELLISFIESLAQPSSYSLSPNVLALVKYAIYSFAINPESALHQEFFPSGSKEKLSKGVMEAGSKLELSRLQHFVTTTNVQSRTGSSAAATALAPEYTESRRGKICGHVFKAGESVYRCRDCAFDATCVLCSKCFHASSHAKQGHDVTMSIHGGVGAGCCDCGDSEAFKEGSVDDCKYHSIKMAPLVDQSQSGEELRETEERIAAATKEVEKLLVILVDWMIQVLDRSPSELVAPKTVNDIMAQLPPQYPSNATSASSTTSGDSAEELAARLLSGHYNDARLAMFSAHGSPTITTSRLASITQPYFPFASSRPPPSAGSPTTAPQASDPFSSITAPPTYVSSTSRGKARATSPIPSTVGTSGSSFSDAEGPSVSKPAGPWSVVLWNDEKHSFDQVIDQVSRATGCTRKRAAAIAQEVDTHGRAVIDISHDPARLVQVSRLISAIDLAVSVRLSTETFLEEVAGALIGILRDIGSMQVAGRGGLLTEVVANVLLGQYSSSQSSRFQKLLHADAKLWKEARKGLNELYVVLLGVSPEIKMNLSVQFAMAYSSIAEVYLLSDREPENSAIFFGVQVFTAPSVAAALTASQSFLSHLIAILYSFFTEQLDPSSNRRKLILPPNRSVQRIDPDSEAFKQKRYFQIFSELNHLMQSPAVRKLICETESLVEGVTAFLDLFTSMNPNTRAVDNHVEYESDTWVTAFNVTIQLGKLARCFGEAFAHATTLQLAQALTMVLGRMARASRFEAIEWSGLQYQVPVFNVANSAVSFHHPLAWLFAELCKHVDLLAPEKLQQIGVANLRQLVDRFQGHLVFMASMDRPLRVIVLVAQIRAGLWVRNGFGIRAQQLHYKEYSLHENTYDQDVFFLQTSLVILDPAHVIAALLARFDIHKWLAESDLSSTAHATYEASQAMLMSEELLYLIIVLVSDPTHVSGLSAEQVLRRELIHNLCLGPSTFSELIRRTSEKFTDDPILERVLHEVAVFKQPVGTSDQGTYTLKPEFYDQVNPYFPRFSRNQREEVDKIVRERNKNRKIGSVENVIVPHRLGVQSGPFVDLPRALESNALHVLIFHALRTGRARGQSLFSEVLVDEALHLIMLALVERPHAIADFALRPQHGLVDQSFPWKDETTLAHVLVKIEEDERMKTVKHKAQWCLEQLTHLLGERIRSLRKAQDDSVVDAKAASEKKRLAAKARQAAILKKFQKQQASFLAGSENIEDEEMTAMGDDSEMAVEGGPEPVKHTLGACIVCQDDLDDSKPFGTLAFVQISNLIRMSPLGEEYQEEVLDTPMSLDRDASRLRPFGIASKKVSVNPDDDSGDGLSQAWRQATATGLHTSACGHMMHFECFQTYYKSIEARHASQPMRMHPENTQRREFICPLCKSLGNTLLPTTFECQQLYPIQQQPPDDFTTWARNTNNILSESNGFSLVPDTQLTSQECNDAQLILGTTVAEGMRLRPCRIRPKLPKSLRESSPELAMVSTVFQTIDPLAREAFPSTSSLYLPNDLVKYTIESIEIAARGVPNEGGIDGVDVNEATGRMLRSLLYVNRLLVGAHPASLLVDRSLTPQEKLAVGRFVVFSHLGEIFNPSLRDNPSDHDLFKLDPLATIIEAAALAPRDFHHVVALAFYIDLAQKYLIIATIADHGRLQGGLKDGVNTEAEIQELETLALIRGVFVPLGAGAIEDDTRHLTLGKHLYSYMLSFLRQASILHHIIYGSSPSSMSPDRSEFSRLIELLKIPSPASVFCDRSNATEVSSTLLIQNHLASLRSMLPSWNKLKDFLPSSFVDPDSGLPYRVPAQMVATAPSLHHPAIYELVGLPRQLDTLVSASLSNPCNSCGLIPDSPALCLFCGTFVCSQSFCCMDSDDEAQHGECNVHMWTCGGSVGMYYMVKHNSLLYLYTDKGSFATPPYLDSHGEVDAGGRRGRNQFPQFLHEGRYDEVRKLWLNHTLPTVVARKLDASTDHGGWTTF